MPYVTALTNVLSQSLGWHRARMTFMARFVLCSLQLTTTNLRRIAVALKAASIPFAIRLRSDRRLRLTPEGCENGGPAHANRQFPGKCKRIRFLVQL
jgi:hypothetical protein